MKKPILQIASKKDGFRRAGRAWSETPTDVDPSEFTDGQMKALIDEPMLIVAGGIETSNPKDPDADSKTTK